MIIPGEIKNFISEQEIESVVKVMSKLPKGENTNKVTLPHIIKVLDKDIL